MYGDPPPPHPGAILAMVGIEFVVFGFFGILLAIGNYHLAKRLGKSAVLWVVLSIIPGVNFVFLYYVIYQVLYAVLDRLPRPPAA